MPVVMVVVVVVVVAVLIVAFGFFCLFVLREAHTLFDLGIMQLSDAALLVFHVVVAVHVKVVLEEQVH